MIYLDFAASSPLLISVKKQLIKAFDEDFSNPSSAHQLGQSSAEKIEMARSKIADSIGAYKSEILFTSGASESNNLAIKGYILANKNKGKHIITSSIEHKCILSICHFLQKEYGYEITYISPKKNGIIDAKDVITAMKKDTVLVSIMHVNNELGSIQPIAEIGKECFKRNIKFHVDAAQSYRKIEINIDDLNIDFLSISAHKIYGPKGIGALYIRDIRETKLQPIIHGAGQEFGLRGGTLATPLILAFATAVTDQTLSQNQTYVEDLSNYLKGKILDFGWKINTPLDNAIPHIINFTVPNLESQLFIANSNILCSNGSACSSLNVEVSYVLREIGLSTEEGLSTIRVSLGHSTSKVDIDELLKQLRH